VMLVSHDRALLRAVCDEFWMVSKGGIAPFDGDLDDYQRYLLDEAKRVREEIKASTSKATKSADKAANKTADKNADKANTGKGKNTSNKSAPISDATRALKRDLEKLESHMATLNTEGAALENRLSSPLPPQEIAELGQRLKTLNKDLAQCEEQWLELSSQVEAATV
jgi:ATP-binding cassette, subfamily F, member 3